MTEMDRTSTKVQQQWFTYSNRNSTFREVLIASKWVHLISFVFCGFRGHGHIQLAIENATFYDLRTDEDRILCVGLVNVYPFLVPWRHGHAKLWSFVKLLEIVYRYVVGAIKFTVFDQEFLWSLWGSGFGSGCFYHHPFHSIFLQVSGIWSQQELVASLHNIYIRKLLSNISIRCRCFYHDDAFNLQLMISIHFVFML